MIILSVGLPKSGSAWYYYMTNDLVVAAGHEDSNRIKEEYNLQEILKFPTCNIQEPTAQKLDLLLQPAIKAKTFAVKTHFPPNGRLMDAMNDGLVKTTFLYRDPRDIAVSGYEAGLAMRRRGESGTFATMRTMEEAILWTKKWLVKTWEPWGKIEGILKVKYEDLLASPIDELHRLNRFLNFNVSGESLKHITARWNKQSQHKKDNPKGHLNKGVRGRHLEVMGDSELTLCRQHLGQYIDDMGYGNP